MDVRPIEGFYELRDKGGVLGNINLRVYFAVVHEERLLLVLGCYMKEDEGRAPGYIKVRMKNLLRHAVLVLKGSR